MQREECRQAINTMHAGDGNYVYYKVRPTAVAKQLAIVSSSSWPSNRWKSAVLKPKPINKR